MFLGWALFGALLGIAASQRKGFSIAIGIIGGIMLGPLAFLMFFMTGVIGGDTNRKCPHCAEFVKIDAKICKHCHQPLPLAVELRPASGTRPPAIRPTSRRPPSTVRRSTPPS